MQRSLSTHHQSGENDVLWMAFLIILIGAAVYGAWHLFHTQIAAAVMASQHALMMLAAEFTDRYSGLDAQVLATNPAHVTPGALWRLLHNVGAFFRYPAAGLIVWLAFVCAVGNAPGRFTRNLDLPKLMAAQAEVFRSSLPYVGRRLALTAPAKSPLPADPALHAGEWIERFALDQDGDFSERRARGELANQLCGPWLGVTDSAPHVRAMLAVFSLHAARKREDAIALLGDLAASVPHDADEPASGPANPLAFAPAMIDRVDALLARRSIDKACAEVAVRHAYTAPALMSALTYAREQAGVLAPAQFAFLKLIDRKLWYALHSLGFPGGQNRAEQPNPRVEAAGARDHWAAECAIGHPLTEPSLDRAIAVIRRMHDQTTDAARLAAEANPRRPTPAPSPIARTLKENTV